MEQFSQFQGIKGLIGHGKGRKQAWGAVLTIGQKDPNKGFPTDTDKFFIKKPQAITKKMGPRTTLFRENDPEFSKFNNSDNIKLRQTIRFFIVHPVNLTNGWESMVDCFQFSLKAHQLPKHKQHPNNAPHCTGNGEEARRWDGTEYKDIKCPNHICEFRAGRPAPCKPFARLAIQLRWEADQPWSYLPTTFIKYETRSWYNIDKVFMPFFMGLHLQATALGVNDYNFYALPCVMKLSKRSSGNGNLVPAVSLSTDLPPGMTLQSFFLQQKNMQKQLQNYLPPIED